MTLRSTGRAGVPRVLALTLSLLFILFLAAVQANTASAGTAYSQLSSGNGYSCGLTTDGDVECWGKNNWGQLGDGTTTVGKQPTDVHTGRATAISVGDSTACAIVHGSAVCWGLGNNGQLGTGSSPLVGTPHVVSGMKSGVTAIAMGAMEGCAVVDGTTKCWGIGYMGNGEQWTNQSLPATVTGLDSGVKSIAISDWGNVCVITADNEAKCWGDAGLGQIGNGEDYSTGTSFALVPTTVSNLTDVESIDVGGGFTCATTGENGGTAYCWGYNNVGQLGVPFGDTFSLPQQVVGLGTGVTNISTGDKHACAAIDDAAVCWGDNSKLQLGASAATGDHVPPTAVENAPDGVTNVSAGTDTSCAVGSQGVFCWGGNGDGQQGVGTSGSTIAPENVVGITGGATDVAVASDHSCAVVAGAVKCWGLGTWVSLETAHPCRRPNRFRSQA